MDAHLVSPLALFQQAGPVGKSVAIILLCASIWCWFIIIEEIFAFRRLLRALNDARSGAANGLGAALKESGEAARALRLENETGGERRARVTEAMTRILGVVFARAEKSLPNLAIIASAAPFIGLFGTVWGIMSSFSAIAASNDTSLAVVAPGIAEALATTAYGLAAAIPASIGYNRLSMAFTRLGQEGARLIEERAEILCAAPAGDLREAV